MNDTRTLALIDDLLAASAETSCVEFKENNFAPPVIGKYISALSNAAALAEQNFAYLLWGVRDSDRAITGTHFDPDAVKRHGQPLAFWLAQRLNPDVAFRFQIVDHPQGRLVLLEIPAATTSPVEFERTAYIRIGSATPRLSDYPDRQKTLWGKLQPYLWESGIAAQFLTDDAVLARIDYASYFALMDQPLMANPQAILERLHQDQIITPDVGGRWNITNLGAILFANRLDEFDSRIARKAVRVVVYLGTSKLETRLDHTDVKGYAVGFQGLVRFIMQQMPQNEVIENALRREVTLVPEIAIRELVANALIHQDFTISGASVMVEIYCNRVEISSPGEPMVPVERFIDGYETRNERLADLMRRMGICEERSSGIDRVIEATEVYQLPPPEFFEAHRRTLVRMFGPMPFKNMGRDDRIRACYQHCALRWVMGEQMTNQSLRERFKLAQSKTASVSQVIAATIDAGLIKPNGSNGKSRKYARYSPFWA